MCKTTVIVDKVKTLENQIHTITNGEHCLQLGLDRMELPATAVQPGSRRRRAVTPPHPAAEEAERPAAEQQVRIRHPLKLPEN